MTRSWDELVADLFDVLAPQYVLLILLAGAGLAGLLWYTFPAWVPRRLPGFPAWPGTLLRRLAHVVRVLAGLPRRAVSGLVRSVRRLFHRLFHRLVRRPAKEPKAPRTPAAPTAPASSPAPQPTAAISVADRLAAEGRYAEAIRERLRETVGVLTRAGVVAPAPGETVVELAAVAATRRPAVASSLDGATELFSEVWYGNRPAGPAQDDHMRTLSGEVRARLQDGSPR